MLDISQHIQVAIAGISLWAQGDNPDLVNGCWLSFEQDIPKLGAANIAHTTDIKGFNDWASLFIKQEYTVSQSKWHSEISAIFRQYTELVPQSCDFLNGIAPAASMFSTYWAEHGYSDFPTVTCA